MYKNEIETENNLLNKFVQPDGSEETKTNGKVSKVTGSCGEPRLPMS